MLLGSRLIVEECKLVGGRLGFSLLVEMNVLSLSEGGMKTGRIWQKCSFRFRACGDFDKFGMRILPDKLGYMSGSGHVFEGERLTFNAVSDRGSRANISSMRLSSVGRVTSIKSPGHTVVDFAGARRTCVRRMACLWLLLEP